MLSLFRSHYPQASLISEVLKLEEGKYIVRVWVQIGGLTLATGLGEANSVEAAEDRARARALDLLDLTPSQINGSTTQTITETFKSVPKSETINPIISNPPSPVIATNGNLGETMAIEETLVPEKMESLESLPKLETPEPDPFSFVTEKQEETGEEVTSPSSLEVNHTPISAEDFSAAILKTNREIKRLNWTKEQGREFLIEHYGKKSRHELNDNELFEFLRYLESQPTPPS